jgi:putative colanic acid biosynthesis glycosyltransferase WcaI
VLPRMLNVTSRRPSPSAAVSATDEPQRHSMLGHRVSLLSLHYPPEETGNAPYTGALAVGLSARAHRVTAHVGHPHYPEWEVRPGYGQWRRTETIEGVTVHRLRHFVPQPPKGIRRLLSELSFGARLLFSSLGSDSVVVAVSPALFATALAVLRIRLTPWRPRLVVWVQDIYTLGLAETKQGGDLTASITRFVERFVLRAADRVIVIHPRFAEYLAQNLGVAPERIDVIRNWTHLKPSPVLCQRDARAALGWQTDVSLAVHTGNMGTKQGLENVVEAARLADEQRAPIKFVLVGDGCERARLEQLAQGIDRIQFVDPLDEADYRCALAAADCLLVNELPGVATMAVPSKLTSYFDAKRPILAATDPTGIAAGEVERANAGVVVLAGDPHKLLAMALQLSEDKTQAAAYGAAGQRYCREHLSSETAMAAFEQVIQDVAARRVDRAGRRS